MVRQFYFIVAIGTAGFLWSGWWHAQPFGWRVLGMGRGIGCVVEVVSLKIPDIALGKSNITVMHHWRPFRPDHVQFVGCWQVVNTMPYQSSAGECPISNGVLRYCIKPDTFLSIWPTAFRLSMRICLVTLTASSARPFVCWWYADETRDCMSQDVMNVRTWCDVKGGSPSAEIPSGTPYMPNHSRRLCIRVRLSFLSWVGSDTATHPVYLSAQTRKWRQARWK